MVTHLHLGSPKRQFFVPKSLREKIFQAIDEIHDVICQPDFKELSQDSLAHLPSPIPDEDAHTHFLQMDFGICIDENGELSPQLIEVQGFPSLYFFQHLLAEKYQEHFYAPPNFNHLFKGLDATTYMEQLREFIIGDCPPENVILLEIEPEKQMTRIDFWIAAKHLGLKVLCMTELKHEGKDVYYLDENGQKVAVHRIFNRVIFDELLQRPDLKREFSFLKSYNVKWIGHPNWFFRISKYTMPLIDSQFVPKTYFLHELETYPEDLENYVLKPLYSFAGAGVKFNVTKADLEAVTLPENYILQRKVQYAPVVQAPDQAVKCELRMLMLWHENEPRATLVNNLARLSKGEMIGVRYNKDKDWVGASVGFFEMGE